MTAIETPTAAQFSEQELAAWRRMLQVHARVTQALDSQMRAEHRLSVSSYRPDRPRTHLTATDEGH